MKMTLKHLLILVNVNSSVPYTTVTVSVDEDSQTRISILETDFLNSCISAKYCPIHNKPYINGKLTSFVVQGHISDTLCFLLDITQMCVCMSRAQWFPQPENTNGIQNGIYNTAWNVLESGLMIWTSVCEY